MSPLLIQALMMSIELAITQFSIDNKNMTEADLMKYIAGQEQRKLDLLKLADEA